MVSYFGAFYYPTTLSRGFYLSHLQFEMYYENTNMKTGTESWIHYTVLTFSVSFGCLYNFGTQS